MLSSTTALPRAGVALVCALRRRVVRPRSHGPRPATLPRTTHAAARDILRAKKGQLHIDAKPATPGEASPKRDLIHGAQQRRQSDLTAQCSGSSTTPWRQLAWQLRNRGTVQRPTVAALGEGLCLASSRHARAREAQDGTRRRRRREHEQTDPRKRAKSSPLARRRSQSATIQTTRR